MRVQVLVRRPLANGPLPSVLFGLVVHIVELFNWTAVSIIASRFSKNRML